MALSSSRSTAGSLRIRGIVLIAISLVAIAVHGKATRNLKLMLPDRLEIISAAERPRMH